MKRIFYLFLSGCLILVSSCTDLEVEEIDSVVTEQDFSNVNVAENLTSMYNDLGGFMTYQNNAYGLMEVTGDIQFVPTRGTDWGDGGVWRQLHQHTWTSSHPDVLAAWNSLNELTFFANQNLLSNPSPQLEAESRFMRAVVSMLIVDLWGVLPDRDPAASTLSDPVTLTREEAVARIEEDLSDQYLEELASVGPGSGQALLAASKAAGHYWRAKFFLNKHILLNGAASNPQPETADLQQVVEDVDAITAEGFSIQDDYFGIFEDPLNSTESIFLIEGTDGSKPRIANTLHYSHSFILPGGGWNGFSTTSEFYNLFEGPEENTIGSGQEERRGYNPEDSELGLGRGLLIGQQWGAQIVFDSTTLEIQDTTYSELSTRGGAPLVFTGDLPSELTGHSEATGIRMLKYPPSISLNEATQVYEPTDGPNFQIFFRYSDAVLMKAEALYRQGSEGEALTVVNDLRALREAEPLSQLTDEEMLAERGRELYTEFWRRQDLIRFGEYLEPWTYKSQSTPERLLFPIPLTAVSTNPNLEQNPGY